MIISEAEFFWPKPIPPKELEAEYNMVIKLIGASLYHGDSFDRDDMTEILGFNRAKVKVTKDSRELLFIKRIRWATKNLWTLDKYLRPELQEEIKKVYIKCETVEVNKAKQLLRSVYLDCNVTQYASGTKNLNWLQSLKHLNDALLPV
ncbi:hypothetical protein [Glaciecola sp. KUL10]|uniref:hypothetical protein n=1 Tax=Glaciecola sp. (strain KUL10) TaxID=2161813 RepID=UPI000D78AFC9|nr:hypothetical protein [Glaciecola sp. KUL10]GBL03150.1 bifunctional ATP-dependent DNA helicase/DNA polymerase III subunit epsilon [Glaciecola sp. KUL10]